MIHAPINRTNKNGLFAQAVERTTKVNLCRNDSAVAAVNKAFAMFLFNSGVCDLKRTQTAFDRRPDWREA